MEKRTLIFTFILLYLIQFISADLAESNDLTLHIFDDCDIVNTCSDYGNQYTCEHNICNLDFYFISDTFGIDCTSSDYDCRCEWDVLSGSCSSAWDNVINPKCGNGIEEQGEECDDGNSDDTDGCHNNCTYNCGLSKPCIIGTHLCDDDTCAINCNFCDQGDSSCNYDGICDTDEGCTCLDCNEKQDQCGEGLICSLEDEQCCNPSSDGWCNPYCTYMDPDCEAGICGNGKEEQGEECDDGNNNDSDGCHNNCTYNCGLSKPCIIGTHLCDDDTCAINCNFCDQGDSSCNYDGICDTDEGCTCLDCNEKQDQCGEGLICSLEDEQCCNPSSDGWCNPYCTYMDPDCGNRLKIGYCQLEEYLSDDCDDGILETLLKGIWKWYPENNFTEKLVCLASIPHSVKNKTCINEPPAWHIDSPKRTLCIEKNYNVIDCPSSDNIPLNFFNIINLIFTFLIIGFIYTVFRLDKK